MGNGRYFYFSLKMLMLVKQNSLDTGSCLVKLVVVILPFLRFTLCFVFSRTQEFGGTAT